MDGSSGTAIRRPGAAAGATYGTSLYGTGATGGGGSYGTTVRRDGGTDTTIKTTYTSRPNYTYTPIVSTTPAPPSTTGRYTPVGGQTLMTRQPSPAASLGREREIPVLREQRITETFKASGKVGPRTDW